MSAGHAFETLFEAVAGAPAAWLDRGSGDVVSVRGGDRIRFLHAMLSNDIESLPEGGTRPALLLNRKGRVLSMLHVLRDADQVWLEASPGTGAEVAGILEKHVIADDVEVVDATSELVALSVEGTGARARLAELSLPAPDADRFERGAFDALWIGGGRLHPSGVRAIVPRSARDALLERVALPVLAPDAAHALHVALGVPRYGVDVTDRNFPQEARLERALSFNKGCYIGQEIVARIQSRGAVNRVLVRLGFDGSVAPGDVVSCEARERLGTLTSVASRPGEPAWLALGYVAVDFAEPGLEVAVGEVRGRILDPDP